jgi:hypothetical protein
LVVYTSRGDAYLIQGDRSGAMRLFNAVKPGENALYALDLGDEVDATPVAYNNYVVVGSTGTNPRLFCFRLQ